MFDMPDGMDPDKIMKESLPNGRPPEKCFERAPWNKYTKASEARVSLSPQKPNASS